VPRAPIDAVRSSARVDPPLEILARAADELARPTTGRMRSIRDEVRRDRLVAVGALLQETLACVSEEIERLLLDECPPDPAGLHERLTERLDVLNRQRLALDNQGINRRGDRENVPAPGPDVPAAAARSSTGASTSAGSSVWPPRPRRSPASTRPRRMSATPTCGASSGPSPATAWSTCSAARRPPRATPRQARRQHHDRLADLSDALAKQPDKEARPAVLNLDAPDLVRLRRRDGRPNLPAKVSMGHSSRAGWVLAVGLVLGLSGACSKEKREPLAKCSTHTKCKAGYKCVNLNGGGPVTGPTDLGECQEDPCAVTVPCETPQHATHPNEPCVNDLVEACDLHNPNKFCKCQSTLPNQGVVTTGNTPTTG
jgi:hypothetical protein